MDKIESIMRILPQSVREIFCHAEIAMEKLQEIRLRVEEPLCVLYEGKEFFVNHAGRMQGGIQGTYLVSAKDMHLKKRCVRGILQFVAGTESE